MPYQIEIKEEAKTEIIEAADFYAMAIEGLEKRFIQQLENILISITGNPKTYKKAYKNFRQAAL